MQATTAKSCNWTHTTGTSFCSHLVKVHKMVLPQVQRTKFNTNILPDVNDPNFFCVSCQVKYKTHRSYRVHLRNAHKMKLNPLRTASVFNPTISVSDAEDPNNTSCAFCKFKYNTKYGYQRHMRKSHKEGNYTHQKRGEITNS